ncbi:bile acid:sodium symporter [Halalkaliarchaeum sp. AArc-GB]|uniref:arsenic resistance protein n=2 Tax=unclassified Halalkaliarchaeum TaxID=2678344 RepID=UPI002859241F|nr:bile acid:sodium symporter [Halalkaliarchaeum sp. AArc-GB]MDR5672834.1 bile acid:sodium symporter [Halalkaliarchaeum sp. AArc-GB]
MIGELFRTIKANLISAVVVSLFLGLVAGQVIGPGTKTALQSAVLPVLFVMIYPMMINIDLQEVLNVRLHARVVLASLLLNFGLAPLVAVALARLFFAGTPEYAVGLYFIALIPTSGMTAAWTGLAGGDLEGALVAMAVNLLAAVVILPLYLSVLLEQGVGFDPAALYRQLAVIVAIPMVAGNLTRRYLLRRYGPEGFKRLKPTFGGISSFGVMLIVFIAMAMRSTEILADPVASALVVVPLVLFYAIVLGAGSAVGRLLMDGPGEVALVYATSMRNLSIAIAIAAAPGFPPASAVLPIALAYVIQPPLGAVYMQYRRDVVEQGLTVRELVASRVRA